MILTVTRGIDLSTVSGPISKAQLNQLGQPTVALVPGSVVAADTNFSSLRITDGTYPFLQLTNTAAPTDKQRLRAFVETSGTTGLSRINDAENVGTSLIAWDANNNCGVSQGAPQAKFHVGGGTVGSVAGSSAEIFRAEWNNGNNATLRLLQVRNSTGGDWTTTTTRLQQFVDTTPQGFIEFNPAGLNYGVALGATNGSNVNAPMLFLTGAGGGNNVGVGTSNTTHKLTVAGDVRLLNNTNAILFTDQSGTTPYLQAQADGQFWFYSTTAAGAARPVWNCAMRSDTAAFLVNVPLKIGASGAEIKTVLTTTFLNPIQTITSGATFTHDIVLTGVPDPSVGAPCVLNATPNNIDTRVIVRAQTIPGTANTVRLVLYNSSAVSIDLSAARYRIEATIY